MKKILFFLILCAVLLLSGCSASKSGEEPSHAEPTAAESSLPEIHMFPEDVPARRMMSLEAVAVKGIPSEHAKTNRKLTYQLTEVLALVHSEPYADGDLWALVRFDGFDSFSDTIGWVRWDQLVLYTDENKHLLTYPVQLAEGCTDLDTGEAVRWDAVRISRMGDDATVTWEDGNSHRVSKDALIFPDPAQVNSDDR